ncbi:hypothetical protein GGI04_003769 [Coemansia thaxteri]|nr:hypothetical protein GGI04_003769 [Coemansia thaxteri]KAJ2469923.1 hypothetical protein GGI02_003287 [Coemansia sp. RSA 2322]KAJ2484492.1 hypothetical protein EV174_002398 [Coemansia sp. RSA 2320]
MESPPPQILDQVARQLLLGQTVGSAGDSVGDSSRCLSIALSEGRYEDVLRSPAAKAIFGTDQAENTGASIATGGPAPSDKEFAAESVGPYVTALVQKYILEHGAKSWSEVTLVGAACLSAFVQTNWTGPEFRLDPATLLPQPLAERWKESFTTTTPLVLEEGMDKHEIGRRSHAARVYLGVTQSEERARLDRALLGQLSADGEEAYSMTPRPLYLILARLLLVDIPASGDPAERDAATTLAHWLSARMLLVQQSLLDYPSQTLMSQIIGHFDKVRHLLPYSPASASSLYSVDSADSLQSAKALDKDVLADMNGITAGVVPDIARPVAQTLADEGVLPTSESVAPSSHEWDSVSAADRDLWARYFVEVGIVYSQHHMPIDAKQYFAKAQAASGLQWEMTGAKGKRTRFQQTDVTQLVLLAKSAQHASGSIPDEGHLPEAMELKDDVILDRIKFTDAAIEEHAGQERLQVTDECILLSMCLNVQNENPAHGLTTELMRPFVARVLERPTNWSVYTMGLLLRSRLEMAKTRTAERATLQLQALVDQITHPLPSVQEAGAAERLQYLYALSLPSQWEFERELANQFMKLGVVRSALDIYERLNMWDEVVSCYVLLGQIEVAQRIITEQLELFPDRPKLWCVLGDLKGEPAHWQHAWEISGQRYARAMRSLGAHHYAKLNYAKAVECYQNALKLNPLFEKSWYVLGCAAQQTKDWELAAVAFQRVVNLESDNGEAWNNLATVYMHMGSAYRERSWYALREAVKARYDSWQVWTNFMNASLGIAQIAPAIQAMTRIIEICVDKDGPACVDLDALRTIISSVTRGRVIEGMDERQARHTEAQFVRQMEQLLVTTIEARISSSAQVWRAMADYWFWRRDYRHCLDCYIKAYRCLSQMPQVAYAKPVFDEAVEAALELVSMYENLGDKTETVRIAAPELGDQETPAQDQNVAAADVATEQRPVCADWRHQAKMLLRSLIGKSKATFEGTPGYGRLVEALATLRQEA